MNYTAISLVIAAGGLGWAIFSYRHTHTRTLSLERTKFIFEQSKFLDTDSSMQTATKILYGLCPNFSVDSYLQVMDSKKDTPERIALAMSFENFLNFLERVAYAHLVLKTITLEDSDAFGYYFDTICTNPALREYCMNQGFEDIVEIAKKLEPLWQEADRRMERLGHQATGPTRRPSAAS